MHILFVHDGDSQSPNLAAKGVHDITQDPTMMARRINYPLCACGVIAEGEGGMTPLVRAARIPQQDAGASHTLGPTNTFGSIGEEIALVRIVQDLRWRQRRAPRGDPPPL